MAVFFFFRGGASGGRQRRQQDTGWRENALGAGRPAAADSCDQR